MNLVRVIVRQVEKLNWRVVIRGTFRSRDSGVDSKHQKEAKH